MDRMRIPYLPARYPRSYSYPRQFALVRIKPKIAAMIVITVLAVSMALTLVAAVGQAVNGDLVGTASAQQSDQESADGNLVRSFKFVCPFH